MSLLRPSFHFVLSPRHPRLVSTLCLLLHFYKSYLRPLYRCCLLFPIFLSLSLSPSRFRSVALYSSVADKVYALVVRLNVYIELLLWFVFETVVGCTVVGLFNSRLRRRPSLLLCGAFWGERAEFKNREGLVFSLNISFQALKEPPFFRISLHFDMSIGKKVAVFWNGRLENRSCDISLEFISFLIIYFRW